ncbi:molybdate ABC transporter substrate-binding protein [Erwinia tasmaniensis]|uniref:molybdate ABC transporter substrate-binding protein n=1 Tax=Erwinia tasmaniensis TaxID=338565 RepID=UPI003A4DFBA4
MSGTTTLRVFSALAVRAPFDALERDFLKQYSHCELTLEWNPTSVIEKKIAAGATADAAILTVPVIERLIEEGVIIADSRVDLVDSRIGLATLPDAVAPDISSLPALKQTLLTARSVAWSLGGASGIYFQTLIQRLGIEAEITSRGTTIPEGFTARQLLTGKADLALQQISELLMVPGVKVIGPLPDEAQKVTAFAGGIFRTAANRQDAAALLASLRTPQARTTFESFGLRCRDQAV